MRAIYLMIAVVIVGGLVWWFQYNHPGWPIGGQPASTQLASTFDTTVPPPDTSVPSVQSGSDTATLASQTRTRVGAPVTLPGTDESSCTVHHNHLFRWMRSGRPSGGHPYADSEEEAFSDAKLDHWLVCNRDRIPEADRAEIKRQLRIENAGQLVFLHDGDRLLTMMDGNDLEDNVEVRLGHEQRALRFEVNANGHHYVILAPLGCWNWALGPDIPAPQAAVVASDCVEIHYPTEEGDIVRFAVLGDEPLPPECFALKAAGEAEFHTPPVHCPDHACDFHEIVAAVGMPSQHSGGYIAHAGENILRLPAIVAVRGVRFETALCLERRGRHTMGVGVNPPNYLGSNPQVARVFVSADAVPRSFPRGYDLWWHWVAND